jgi:Domain of unknown function (DUF4258)
MTFMGYQYTSHAEESLLRRRIEKARVEDTIEMPESVIDSRFGRKIAQKTFGHKALRVVFEEEHGIYIVVTAYYTEIERYGRTK